MRGRGTEEVMGDIWPESRRRNFSGKGGDQRGVSKRESGRMDKKESHVGTNMPHGDWLWHRLSKYSGMREKASKQDPVPY